MCLLSKLLLGRLSHSLLGQLFKLGNFLNDLNWLEREIPLVMCLLFCVGFRITGMCDKHETNQHFDLAIQAHIKGTIIKHLAEVMKPSVAL